MTQRCNSRLTEHDWSDPLHLSPTWGTKFEYCRECGAMRLAEDSRKWMNEHNPKEVEGVKEG